MCEQKIEIRELTLKHGLSYPSDEELIMLILGHGTKKTPVDNLSVKVLEVLMKSNYENLIENLIKISGIGKTKALAVAAALELGRRQNRNPQSALSHPKDVIPFIQSYALSPTEHFICITLNGAREILSIRVVCTGSGNMAIIRMGDVFSEAIKEHASAVVFCHNHPGGNPSPSDDDIKTTKKLYAAAQLLQIAFLDHIIITRNSYFSFLEHNMFEMFDEEAGNENAS